MRLACTLFGSPHAEVVRDDGTRRAIPLRLIPLLAFLVAHRGTPLERGHLAATLWPDVLDDEARSNLRRHVHLLATELDALADASLAIDKQRIGWRADAPCDIDLLAFEAGSTAAYRDEFMAGVEADWLDPVRERLARRYGEMLANELETAIGAGDTASAVTIAARMLAHDPWNEDLLRVVLDLRVRSGDRAGAIADYQTFERRLRADLGSEPMPETRAAYEAMVDTPDAGRAPNNLPHAGTRFIGRERDVAEAGALLRAERSVTLRGPGGIGKTRLAVRIASSLGAAFPDGMWFVDLAAAGAGTDIAQRVAEAMGVPIRSNDPLAALLDRQREKRFLIVLDACEGLVDAARTFVAGLMAAVPEASVLVTTRRSLGYPGESVYVVDPLPDAIGTRLFADRAANATPEFALTPGSEAAVRRIVARLGGLPLAIELAAARLSLLTVDGLAKRLDDRLDEFVRSGRARGGDAKTLEDIVRWSYELLSPNERQLLVRLAVFPTDFSLEAVQAICASDGDDVFEPLSELVEASLVHVRATETSARYAMLDTTRAFARALFDNSQERDEIAARHSEFFFAFLTEHGVAFRGRGEAAAYAVCAPELSNLRAVLDRALGGMGFEGAAALAAAFSFVFYRVGYAVEGARYLTSIVADPAFEALPARVRAHVHRSISRILVEFAEYRATLDQLHAALALFRETGDEADAGDALAAMAAATYYLGDYAGSRALFTEAIPALASGPLTYMRANTIGNFGALELAEGNLDVAEPLLIEAAEMWTRLEMPARAYMQYTNLALVAYYRGEAERAVGFAEIAVRITIERGTERHRQADAYSKLGMALRLAARFGEAWDAHCRAIALTVERDDYRIYQAEAFESAAQTALAAGNARIAAMALARADAMRDRIESPVNPIGAEALATARAAIASSLGDIERAEATLRAGAMPAEELLALLRASRLE